MKKILKVVSVFVIMALIFTACSAGAGTGNSGSQAATGKKHDLIMGTAGTSGTYYIVGVAMGQAVSDKSKLDNIVVQSSLGSMENINLTNSNQMQLGMSNADGVFFAYNGTGPYAKNGKQDILGVMSLYKSAGQMVATAKSGIKTYADLKGKKVVLGPPSTTITEMSKAILRAYGIDPEKDITPYYLTFDEGLTKVVDGEVDAAFMVAGTPTAAVMNATATTPMALVDADPAILAKIAQEQPYYEPYTIPAGTYKGIDYNVNTLKIMTQIFTNSKTSEDEIYEFVKSALENVDSYKDAHAVVKEITKESAAKMSIPLHPGAEKYFKEIGVLK
jgi:TRAP transporter TAXI family solute receptor